jgi:hypothetical protein
LEDTPEESKCWKWHPKEILEEEDDDSSNSELNNATVLLKQFQVGAHKYISMGGNRDSSSGLQPNEDLTKAKLLPMAGFDNDSLAGDFFEVRLIEVYQMVQQMDGVAGVH